ncbi:MAG TPA: lasso peptide biosynthesis B2 protein [Acidimicrobiia bacterium]
MIRHLARRTRLMTRIWLRYATVKVLLGKRQPLADTIDALRRRTPASPIHQEPRQLGRSVVRALRVGRLQPRCLTLALIHMSLLNDNGTPGQLVIGLPDGARSPRAHAWIEIDGVDIGPPPGRHGHQELVRYF